MTHLTTFEQSKGLKEVGMNILTRTYFHVHLNKGTLEEFDEEEQKYNDSYSWHYSRPTLDEVVNWLRDARGLHVSISPTLDWSKWLLHMHDKNERSWESTGAFDTHHAALSAAITQCLTILKDRK